MHYRMSMSLQTQLLNSFICRKLYMFWYIIKKYPTSLNISIPSIVLVYSSIKICKKMLPVRNKSYIRNNRNVEGHRQEVTYQVRVTYWKRLVYRIFKILLNKKHHSPKGRNHPQAFGDIFIKSDTNNNYMMIQLRHPKKLIRFCRHIT